MKITLHEQKDIPEDLVLVQSCADNFLNEAMLTRVIKAFSKRIPSKKGAKRPTRVKIVPTIIDNKVEVQLVFNPKLQMSDIMDTYPTILADLKKWKKQRLAFMGEYGKGDTTSERSGANES